MSVCHQTVSPGSTCGSTPCRPSFRNAIPASWPRPASAPLAKLVLRHVVVLAWRVRYVGRARLRRSARRAACRPSAPAGSAPSSPDRCGPRLDMAGDGISRVCAGVWRRGTDHSRASRRQTPSRRRSGSPDRSSARPCRHPYAATGRGSRAVRLPAAHAVGVGALHGWDRRCLLLTHSRSRKARVSASLAVLPRHPRPRPVDVEGLRFAGFQRREVFVEAALFEASCARRTRFVLQIAPDLLEPLRSPASPERRRAPRQSCADRRLGRRPETSPAHGRADSRSEDGGAAGGIVGAD